MRDNGKVIELTEPQVWVLIGVFAAGLFGVIGIVMTTFHRTLIASIGGLEAQIGGLDAKIDGLRAEMNARFETMDVKFAALDKDVQALMRHAFGSDSR